MLQNDAKVSEELLSAASKTKLLEKNQAQDKYIQLAYDCYKRISSARGLKFKANGVVDS